MKKKTQIRTAIHKLGARFVNLESEHRLQLPDLSQIQVTRIYDRLTRLYDLYRIHYRTNGNLKVPEPTRNDGDSIIVKLSDPVGPNPDLDNISGFLSPQEADVLLYTLLAQLEQLENLNYTLDTLSPDNIFICKRAKYWAVELHGLEHGRFLDESIGKDNRVSTSWASPEYWRQINFDIDSTPSSRGDIFAAGCFYYKLLTGNELKTESGMPPGEAIVKGIPVSIDGPHQARLELVCWMIQPNPNNRPTIKQVMDSLSVLRVMGNVSPGELPGECPSPLHSTQQRLLTISGHFALSRRLSWLWAPDNKLQQLKSPLFERQVRYRKREKDRLTTICKLSNAWNATCPRLVPCSIQDDYDSLSIISPLPDGPLLMLGQMLKQHDTPFLLDARMVDLLLAVHTIHEDGWILGLLSEDRFCIQSTPSGGQAWVVDLSAAMPLSSLPMPCDIRQDAAADKLLSPELALYIVSTSEDERQTAEGWVSPASDVFSLGLLYHLLLTGRFPTLLNPRMHSYAEAVSFTDYAWNAIELDSRLDERHKNLIYDMLNANPMERPADCGVLAWKILRFYTA